MKSQVATLNLILVFIFLLMVCCLGYSIYRSVMIEIKDETLIAAEYKDWGVVNNVGPCSSGKYSHRCKVNTDKVWLRVDLRDLPNDIISVGDKVGAEEKISEREYTKRLCVNHICTSAVEYEKCYWDTQCYADAAKRLIKN